MNNPGVVYMKSNNLPQREDPWAFALYKTLWVSQEAIVVKEKGINVLHSCLTPERQTFPVIARKEYELIWQHASAALANDDGCGGLVVYGQPGIGKSLFLLYALAHALRARIPVAWCTSPIFFYFFDDQGVSRWKYSNGSPRGCLLALFDTVGGMEYPKGTFTGKNSTAFVIQATSPKLSRWKEWSKQINAELWVMDIWDPTEIDYIRRLKPTAPGCYDPVEVSAYLGPSARHCTEQWQNTGNPTMDFGLNPLSFEDTDILHWAFCGYGIEEDGQRDDFYQFFFATPDPTFRRPVRASGNLHVTHLVPTNFLRNIMFDSYCSLSDTKLEELCQKYKYYPVMFSAMSEVLDALSQRQCLPPLEPNCMPVGYMVADSPAPK